MIRRFSTSACAESHGFSARDDDPIYGVRGITFDPANGLAQVPDTTPRNGTPGLHVLALTLTSFRRSLAVCNPWMATMHWHNFHNEQTCVLQRRHCPWHPVSLAFWAPSISEWDTKTTTRQFHTIRHNANLPSLPCQPMWCYFFFWPGGPSPPPRFRAPDPNSKICSPGIP